LYNGTSASAIGIISNVVGWKKTKAYNR
jgi:hypothetical protein